MPCVKNTTGYLFCLRRIIAQISGLNEENTIFRSPPYSNTTFKIISRYMLRSKGWLSSNVPSWWKINLTHYWLLLKRKLLYDVIRSILTFNCMVHLISILHPTCCSSSCNTVCSVGNGWWSSKSSSKNLGFFSRPSATW